MLLSHQAEHFIDYFLIEWVSKMFYILKEFWNSIVSFVGPSFHIAKLWNIFQKSYDKHFLQTAIESVDAQNILVSP